MSKPSSRMTSPRSTFKPFNYEWAFEYWLKHEQAHWLHTEVPMSDDINDWNNKLTEEQKNFLTHLFRFFTQGDVDVASAYVNNYLPIFPQPEMRMMLLGFGAREAVHIAAYSHLIESLGMPETTYNEFMKYKEMADKHAYLEEFTAKDERSIAQQIAVFSLFTEGLQLFSTFAMLLNFPRHGLMRKMGQIVTWSIRDESIHIEAMTRTFVEFIKEHPHIWTKEFKAELVEIGKKMVELEDAFIDLTFNMVPMLNMTAEETKQYIRYVHDRRLISVGLKGTYKVKKNPLPWIDLMINAPIHGNFFEQTITDYSKGAHVGDWSQVWGAMKRPTLTP